MLYSCSTTTMCECCPFIMYVVGFLLQLLPWHLSKTLWSRLTTSARLRSGKNVNGDHSNILWNLFYFIADSLIHIYLFQLQKCREGKNNMYSGMDTLHYCLGLLLRQQPGWCTLPLSAVQFTVFKASAEVRWRCQGCNFIKIRLEFPFSQHISL